LFFTLISVADQSPVDNNKPEPLNVLMISVDDLNDWVGALGGHPQAKTPNIDKLAQRGMLFTNAHAPSPVCNSSRTSIMTGLLPSTTGIYENGQPSRRVIENNFTINEMFKQQGYFTAGAGKILHLFYHKKNAWDKTIGKLPDVKSNPKEMIKIADQFKAHPYANHLESKSQDASMTSWVIEEIQKPRTKPFFIAAGIYRPHLPWRIPQKYFDAFPEKDLQKPTVNLDDLSDLGPIAFKWAMKGPDQQSYAPVSDVTDGPHGRIDAAGDWGKGMQAYLASIMFADAQIGRILDALESSPAKDNTAIVLWSDHGWHLGEKMHWRKGTLWEESTRVPFIFYIPGVTTGNSRSHEAVSIIDLFPTLAEIIKVSLPIQLDGQSLLPIIKDPNKQKESPAIIEYGKRNIAIRGDRYRYIQYSDGAVELYDHQTDPNEWTNLASDTNYADIIARLSKSIPQNFATARPKRL
jgi:arylsulfatase A-like enzyme